LIIAQRLARKLCTHCKVPVDLPAEALRKEGFSDAEIATGLKIYKAVGCGQCSDGYKGRVGIYQVMPITEEISRIILKGGDAMQIADQATKEGVWDLRRAAMEKVKNGLTSLDEMHLVTVE
jgi:type IV pilus assembly protein PilB